MLQQFQYYVLKYVVFGGRYQLQVCVFKQKQKEKNPNWRHSIYFYLFSRTFVNHFGAVTF